MGALQEREIAAAKLRLIVQRNPDEGGEAADRERAVGVLEKRRHVRADLGRVRASEVFRPWRLPGVDFARRPGQVR